MKHESCDYDNDSKSKSKFDLEMVENFVKKYKKHFFKKKFPNNSIHLLERNHPLQIL